MKDGTYSFDDLRSLGFGASLRNGVPSPAPVGRLNLRSLGFGASLRNVVAYQGRDRPRGISEVSASELH